MLEESEQVNALIAYLQSLHGRQLWTAEASQGAGGMAASASGAGSLAGVVRSIVGAMFFESDFRERWAAEALQWLLESSNAQHVALSHQVRMAIYVQYPA